MRVLVGDRFGRLLEEITPNIDSIVWALNQIGKTRLTSSRQSKEFNETLLGIGNRIYIEFDNGLPPWGGVLGLPRAWSSTGVEIACYTIEYLLQARVTDKNASFYERPAGVIFELVLEREENQDPMGITMGSIWGGGSPHWPVYHHTNIWDVLDYSIRRMERCDFTFTPYLEDDHIKFRADFFQIAGSDKTATVAFMEGRNAGEVLKLEEQGVLLNAHYAISEGSVWDEDRLVIVGKDLESIAKYGLRESGKVYAGTSMQSTLEMHARNVIRIYSEPRRYFRFPVTNSEPGKFDSYALGDTVRCALPSFGFDGYEEDVRILVREYNPVTGYCELVVEEPNEPLYWIYQEDLPEE